MKTLKILVISVLILFIAFSCSINKELSVIKIYDPNFRPLPAQIISVNGLNNFKFPFAITRLENKKLTLMVRDSSGKMAPFFVKGIETGFWDTRKPETDYDQVFENYRKLGSSLKTAVTTESKDMALIYYSDNSNTRVNNILNKEAEAYWFYPQNGEIRKVDSFKPNESRNMIPPDKWEDAILVLHVKE